ncbi:MAG: asparagine synthetase B [Salinivirgaceae bacterium]|nr:asparagine synthetase B [Salinivirgaceae bacterium]
MRKILLIFILLLGLTNAQASYLLIPMDESQSSHLKAYGIAHWVLENQISAQWLLNYRGGSFLIQYDKAIETECVIRNVSYEILADAKVTGILNDIAREDVNMDALKLEKAPKIAVYSPKDKLPWDDAVTMVLTYAEIPYTVIYDEEIVNGELSQYDWLHLHHEDFTGQYGKFYAAYKNMGWYTSQVRNAEAEAKKLGFNKVSQLKLYVAQSIKQYVGNGGFLFAMCSATDSYDIALAAEQTDICEYMYDGDGMDPQAQEKLDFSKTFAFQNFTLERNPLIYEYSDIDVTTYRKVSSENDYFTLFEFSAKWDQVPTMLCQNHETTIRAFMGQTTAFNSKLIKPNVLIMGENKAAGEARYIHGEYGQGTWTFYGGHDPEDYQHFVGDKPTNLEMHPNSPGYRLILNNVLFPAAKKKKQKT